ncbi:pantetheine-phosphate adenylyltransferase [Tessaracoccus antarcticus]|uniref:Phosphopantetheine adenylyltransferase n=1 Tax=Tessaracoccus antarcticus TaxID=2479848 RepID=A0A3M0G4L7_9ACTN|nr:pantetheine-phosphate adenylyltransferase [Tessaracoccus antarcticus]RMB59795.1 pantetheine-phosphate adenylyltransferase [Tessaracoccus antarcticus]
MTPVLCPGSFDPITVGHIDIIRRARELFGNVLVGVGRNNQKQYLFGDQRIDLVREALDGMDGVDVAPIEGLLVDFCRDNGITTVIKGLRFGADFDFELQMAHMNRGLTGLETVLLPAAAEHVTLSSTILREVMKLGGDVDKYVPDNVARAIRVWRDTLHG